MKNVHTYTFVETRNRLVAEYNKLQEYENTVKSKEVQRERENKDQTENKNNQKIWMDGWTVRWMIVGRKYRIHVYTDREENVKDQGGRDKTGKQKSGSQEYRKNTENGNTELHDICGGE